jgi:outer membrane protein assembly factor BamB
MLSRRTALLAPVALAACTDPKPKILGKQIPVLTPANVLDVSADAPPVAFPAAVALDAWAQSFANAAHSPGNVAGPLSLTVRWAEKIGAAGGYRQPLSASPLIAGNSVFAMDANAEVSARALADGAESWRTRTRPKHATEQNIGGGIAYAAGKIYASTGYAELLCLDAGSGKILWRQALDFPTRSAPTVSGGLVAVVTQNDLLLTFSADSGNPGWRFAGQVGDLGAAAVAVSGAPAIAEGIVVAGFASGTLAALDANSGTALWEQSLASSFGQASSLDFTDIVAPPVIANGVVYVIGLGNTAMAVDLHSGAKVFTRSVAGMNAFYAAGAFLFLLDSDQKLSAIDADNGLVSWQLQMPQFTKPKKKKGPLLWNGPVLIAGRLVLNSSNGETAFVDPVAGKISAVHKLNVSDMIPVAAAGVLAQLSRDATLTIYG